MHTTNLSVAKAFSNTPGPRYIKEGDYSGEAFRKEILLNAINNAIKEDKMLEVELDGTAGYGTSFLEESFGGLIRVNKLDYETIKKHLHIISDEEPWLIDDVYTYMKEAKEQINLITQ